MIAHTPLTDTPSVGPYPVVATCTSPSGIAAVRWRLLHERQTTGTAAMTPTGTPNEYAGRSGFRSRVTINYFIVAENLPRPCT